MDNKEVIGIGYAGSSVPLFVRDNKIRFISELVNADESLEYIAGTLVAEERTEEGLPKTWITKLNHDQLCRINKSVNGTTLPMEEVNGATLIAEDVKCLVKKPRRDAGGRFVQPVSTGKKEKITKKSKSAKR